MEDVQAKALVSLIEAAWMPMPESKLRLWIEELRDVECRQCAYQAIRSLIREVHFAPAIADFLAEYVGEHREAHGAGLPALPAERWTEEDEAASMAAGARALATWHDRRAGEEPAEVVARAVAQPREQLSAREIERRRAEQLGRLAGEYGEQIEAERVARATAQGKGEQGGNETSEDRRDEEGPAAGEEAPAGSRS